MLQPSETSRRGKLIRIVPRVSFVARGIVALITTFVLVVCSFALVVLWESPLAMIFGAPVIFRVGLFAYCELNAHKDFMEIDFQRFRARSTPFFATGLFLKRIDVSFSEIEDVRLVTLHSRGKGQDETPDIGRINPIWDDGIQPRNSGETSYSDGAADRGWNGRGRSEEGFGLLVKLRGSGRHILLGERLPGSDVLQMGGLLLSASKLHQGIEAFKHAFPSFSEGVSDVWKRLRGGGGRQ